MSNVKHFARMGFQGLVYQSGSDLEPVSAAMPELLGVMMRTQRWSTFYSAKAKEVETPSDKPVFVHARDVEINGVQGGVEEEIE